MGFWVSFYLIILNFNIAYAETALQLFSRDLEPAVKTLSRETQMYHYFNAPTVQDSSGQTQIHSGLHNADMRKKWLADLIKSRAGVFWDLNNHSQNYINAGPGMYFAIDPHSSTEFGNAAVVLRFATNTKYLSILNPIPLAPDTRQKLVEEGIITRSQLAPSATTLGLNAGFTGFALKNMVRPENLKFREFINNFMRLHNIVLVEYLYKSHLAGFCKVASQSSFVFIGSAPITSLTLSNIDLENNYSKPIESEIKEDFHYFEPPQNITPNELENSEQNIYTGLMYSELQINNYSLEEQSKIDLIKRFKYVLAQIRTNGTGVAKQILYENFSQAQMDELANESYECTRRH